MQPERSDIELALHKISVLLDIEPASLEHDLECRITATVERVLERHPKHGVTDHVTLTVGQVATILDLHVETIRGYIHLPVSDSKHLRSVKASTQYRIPPVWLAEWMERNEYVPDDANWLNGLAAA